MLLACALAAWASLGAISAAIHMLFVFRSLSGREGPEWRAVTVEHAAWAGGKRRWITINIAWDMLMPWLTVQGLMITYRKTGVE
jgi:hypothetical protein